MFFLFCQRGHEKSWTTNELLKTALFIFGAAIKLSFSNILGLKSNGMSLYAIRSNFAQTSLE